MTAEEAVKWMALNCVFDLKRKNPKTPDPEFFLRKVFRWYSKTFVTPLDEVEDLPLADVLRHFYEYHFEEMLEDQPGEKPGSGFRRLEQVRQDMLEDPEVLAARQREEDADDVLSYEMAEEMRQQDLQDAAKATVDRLQAATDALNGLGTPTPPKAATSELKKPELSIRFDPNLDLDEDPVMFGLLDRPKTR